MGHGVGVQEAVGDELVPGKAAAFVLERVVQVTMEKSLLFAPPDKGLLLAALEDVLQAGGLVYSSALSFSCFNRVLISAHRT